MKVNLSIVLDYEGNIKENLLTMNSLLELDNYLNKYHNSKEIRDEYRDIIEEFLMDNKNYLQKLNSNNGKNKRNYQGRITICFYGKGNLLRFIPIIYSNERLIDFDKGIIIIKKSLNDDFKLEEFYHKKKFLLSQYEIDCINNYYKFHNSKRKEEFIDSFINRLKVMDKEKRYYYFRSLSRFFSLINSKIKTKYGTIGNVNVKGNNSLKREQISNCCADDFFIDLLDKGDYEEMFKYYDIDKIEKYSNDKDSPIGLRR